MFDAGAEGFNPWLDSDPPREKRTSFGTWVGSITSPTATAFSSACTSSKTIKNSGATSSVFAQSEGGTTGRKVELCLEDGPSLAGEFHPSSTMSLASFRRAFGISAALAWDTKAS